MSRKLPNEKIDTQSLASSSLSPSIGTLFFARLAGMMGASSSEKFEDMTVALHPHRALRLLRITRYIAIGVLMMVTFGYLSMLNVDMHTAEFRPPFTFKYGALSFGYYALVLAGTFASKNRTLANVLFVAAAVPLIVAAFYLLLR